MFAAASVVGKAEREGPLGEKFDLFDTSDRFGQATFETSEGEMQRIALSLAMKKLALSEGELDAVFAGDLLNQCVGSAYGLLEYDVPYFGLYGACSTAAEGLALAAICTSRRAFSRCAVVTSSHNAAAERQYRNPTEYGGQRTPTAQWTVTGSGAFIVASEEICRGAGISPVFIKEVLPGTVVEKGITDTNNMGAAMAPAALRTLSEYFEASGTEPSDFDAIVTGDLGKEGVEILSELLAANGVHLGGKLDDCGLMIYDRSRQDVHSGGSGCGCSAVVLASYLLPRIAAGELGDVLFVGTGAMMSPSSTKQGQAIPAVAHLVRFSGRRD